MAYKVSYKILRQQGEDMKAVAKLVDGYAERVTQVSGKLGEGDLLSQVRGNLGRLREQLGESRTVLNTAGEFLVKTVESYTGAEVRQVKKADGTRAHNRDFYKNPVVVASVGGAGLAAAMPPPAAGVNTAANPTATPAGAPAAPVNAAAQAPPSGSNTAGAAGTVAAAAGSALGGAAIAAGAIAGGLHLKKKQNAALDATDSESAQDEYNPEVELEKALQRVRDLENESE